MIKHIKCDIFKSDADIICRQVNCQGVMGSGIAKQVKEKYPKVFEEYCRWCDTYNSGQSMLGKIQPVFTDDNKIIINIFAQHDFGYDGKCYTDYTSLEKALRNIDMMANEATIAIPYLMGCHRGGGDWRIVYAIIQNVFENSKNSILICEYNGG